MTMAYAPRIALTESPRINSQCALMFGVPSMLAAFWPVLLALHAAILL